MGKPRLSNNEVNLAPGRVWCGKMSVYVYLFKVTALGKRLTF